jgi:hypothetical protein
MVAPFQVSWEEKEYLGAVLLGGFAMEEGNAVSQAFREPHQRRYATARLTVRCPEP